MNENNDEFIDIRPYSDEQFPAIKKRLADNKYLQGFLRGLKWPQCPKLFEPAAEKLIGLYIRRELGKIKTIEEFQKDLIVAKLMQWIVDKTTDGVSSSGLENLDKNMSYLFISNHRDIVLDSALINYFLVHDNFDTTQIAFGDNLLINDFVSDLIRINKSFIVRRNLPLREQIQASITLSKYINHTLETGDSIWIAQKEGRSKDGADLTNPAIIKMFYLSQRKSGVDFSNFINKCRIVPVSISYELDPCDTLKGWEVHRMETREAFLKTKTMDLISMWTGMKGAKGHVHIHYGKPLEGTFLNDKEVALALDREIHRGYKLWSSNYISYDEINQTGKYADRYSEEERTDFLSRYRKLGEPVLQKVLSMYARPVTNQEEAVFTNE
ncbi:MAG: 1-acyl-sn-glycerol-3-phosphate acyltransferase [Spirochaetales bacterium]|nr:1-acyl-sn-glycerol-3-phosphate acyltransferase [Spirochaetales bacterium]